MALTEFTAEVDRISSDQWSELTERFEDANFYQTWAYGAISWGEKNLSHLILRRGPEVVAIAQVRVTPWLPARCGIAYLRWGPLCHLKHRDLDLEIVKGTANALHEEYVRKRGLLLRVLPNSYSGTRRAELFESAFHQFSSEPIRRDHTYRTLVLDLSPRLEDLRKGLDQKWRNQLNRAEKNNLSIVEGYETRHFRSFIALYDQMLARKRFVTSSNVNNFLRMQPHLPERHRLRVLICEDGGIPCAGVIATAIGDSGIYLFGATSNDGIKSKGAYLLQWHLVKWLKEIGIRYYDLGGINPDTNPGVYHFKSGLSGRDVLYTPAFTSCDSLLSNILMKTGSIALHGFRALRRGLPRLR